MDRCILNLKLQFQFSIFTTWTGVVYAHSGSPEPASGHPWHSPKIWWCHCPRGHSCGWPLKVRFKFNFAMSHTTIPTWICFPFSSRMSCLSNLTDARPGRSPTQSLITSTSFNAPGINFLAPSRMNLRSSGSGLVFQSLWWVPPSTVESWLKHGSIRTWHLSPIMFLFPDLLGNDVVAIVSIVQDNSEQARCEDPHDL